MTDQAAPPRRPVRTLADLAQLAGVSTGTVSRALADKSLVNPETRQRIQALAAEHGFRPNQMARRLRTQKTGVIGIVVPLGHERRQHLSDPFFMTMLGHLADALTENGYDVMLSRIIPDAADWLERIVDSGMLDGVLLIGQSDQMAAIERVAQRYRPLIAWGTSAPGQIHCAVGTENVVGGRLAGEHLIARGVRRIAFLGELRAPEIRQRYAGICAAAEAAGMPAPLQLDTHLASDMMEQEIAGHMARHLDRIDGIAAGSDVIAMTTLRVLADQGMAVPGDVPVVGYDDLPLALQTVPRLTTVKQDIAGGAKAMVEALFARIEGQDSASVVMQPELVVRDSA
ncbi:LacI family DNA-binding transcriptional regulator [Sphingomonas sp. HT-1]|uniref:LacI family DNA-binding transcriptional regulator n=1 Tax=unclassified Sphingomonas TaxID=196159 RepID=UPI0004750C37|nr:MULTISPECIES: LacI family DNA-binding transcriptional regulator [unclassified Sphingomonas]KTF68690.1 LacI family transcriptional regulator [Sphingomonas sp. WG]